MTNTSDEALPRKSKPINSPKTQIINILRILI